MRLRHMNQNYMPMLSKKQNIPGLKSTDLEVCAHYLVGKQHRVSFNTLLPFRKANVLDLVHTDICSMDATSLSGARYNITFIDDYSSRVCAYALKSKGQTLEKFKYFHVS